jgi:hypothetical protein
MNKSVKSSLAKLRNALRLKEKGGGIIVETDVSNNTKKRIRPGQKLYTRKHCQFSMWQVSWLVTFLPPFPFAFGGQWTSFGKNFSVTYSCATARDLHTVPY